MELDTKKIIEALKKLDMPEYRHFDDEEKEISYRQVCQDLLDLAEKDGCIGAAFALSVFSAIASSEETITVEFRFGYMGSITSKYHPDENDYQKSFPLSELIDNPYNEVPVSGLSIKEIADQVNYKSLKILHNEKGDYHYYKQKASVEGDTLVIYLS
jgi:hypothetical protein